MSNKRLEWLNKKRNENMGKSLAYMAKCTSIKFGTPEWQKAFELSRRHFANAENIRGLIEDMIDKTS